jgi:TldD protein
MHSSSRRAFLTTSSLAAAGLSLGLGSPGYARAMRTIPARSKQPVGAFFPDLIDPALLRRLAVMGVDAARQAGASYADIRVGDRRLFSMRHSEIVPVPTSTLDFEYVYGLRVLVDGTWGFTFGIDPTADGLVRAARAVVATTRGIAQFSPRVTPLAPTPVVQGEWATPVQIDPFSVSPDAHEKMLGAYCDAAQRVRDGLLWGNPRFVWTSETRVFASTDGSLVTQRLARAEPKVFVENRRPYGARVVLPLMEFSPASAGFEIALGANLQERIKQVAEEAARLASYPRGEAEVGRYEAVVDGTVLGSVFTATLARALEMDRVTGEDADGAGTSMLAPIHEVLGQPLFSPLLNVTAERTAPMYGAARWDDEGVTTASYPVIRRGTVVDYFTTRSSAPMLAAWYAKNGKPMQSHGAAIAWTPALVPTGCASQLTMAASDTRGMTLDALAAQLSHGILARSLGIERDVYSDPQLSGGTFTPVMLYEVKRGQITRHLRGGAVQFNTKRFWNSLTTLGDSSTLQSSTHVDYRGPMWVPATLPIVAPAAQLRQLEVLQFGRRG